VIARLLPLQLPANPNCGENGHTPVKIVKQFRHHSPYIVKRNFLRRETRPDPDAKLLARDTFYGVRPLLPTRSADRRETINLGKKERHRHLRHVQRPRNYAWIYRTWPADNALYTVAGSDP